MLDTNLISIITILIGLITLFFFILDKYPMETVSIGLLSSLALLHIIFPNNMTLNITDIL